jgi:hypothetical protein
MGLRVATEQRARFDDIRPLGKSLTPPFVVLGNRVKLREVQSQDLHTTSIVGPLQSKDPKKLFNAR